ncbi:hypothetical protein E1B28_011249 [Marasmius oreades]|uniref:Uncharacterized protein n=1 Tax=Marasmius oreades TaxID=181124 RepID=A0A9P7UPC8_9AGAR|nr:uncharacterized protein E1B28_011249 [Marasmius oreades]KAG7089582.1 hypothetical protein E1B28_011249 [Marasmius oreades]
MFGSLPDIYTSRRQSLQDGNNFNGPSLQHFDQQTGTSMSWTVNVPAGQSVAFLLRDTSGQTSLSAPVAVQGGTQDSCVNKSISFAPSSSGQASATGGATPPNTAAAGATPVTAPTQSRSSGSSPSKSTTAASSSSNAAAPKLAVSGVVIPALAALFGYIMA